MDHQFTTILSLQDTPAAGPDPADHSLVIHFKPDALEILWLRKQDRQPLGFTVLKPDHPVNTAKEEAIRPILRYLQASHPWFVNNAINLTLLVPGRGFTLVPDMLFDPLQPGKALEPAYVAASAEVIASEKLSRLPAFAVYALPWFWNAQLRMQFLDYQVIHEDFGLINFLAGNYLEAYPRQQCLFLYRRLQSIYLIVIDIHGLKLFNRFNIAENQDVLFYVQFVLQQLLPSTAGTELLLIGSETDDKDLLQLLVPYFTSVKPIALGRFGQSLSLFKKHRADDYLPILSMALCG